ncbi:MAG: terminase small subunit [Gammaproteobacteria bacterium]|nr:terminase small subunit [Gammaproteobacteria bacterium]
METNNNTNGGNGGNGNGPCEYRLRRTSRRLRRTSPPNGHSAPTTTPQKLTNGKKEELNAKRQIFVDEYLKDFNGVRAYTKAFPNTKNANVAGVEAFTLLKNPKIEAAIQRRRDELAKKCEIDREWVLERYKRLVEYKMSDFFYDDGTMKPFSEIPQETLYAVQGFKAKHQVTTFGKGNDKQMIQDFVKEFNLPKKRGVLDSICKLLGLNVELEGGAGGKNFNFNAPVQFNVNFEEG